MNWKPMLGTISAAGIMVATLAAQTQPPAKAEADRDYQQGLKAINDAQWDQALATLKQAQALKAANADAATYWSAYAQEKLGQLQGSLSTLSSLQRDYPDSKWVADARALELEIRQQSGQTVAPAAEGDDDLKLLAINGLMQSDATSAVPLLQKVITGNSSEKVKERALFVLAQNNSGPARQAVVAIASGPSSPDLRMRAVQYLGMMGGAEGRDALASIYTSSNDNALKKQILQSYVQGRDQARLLAAAQNEKDPELRSAAIRDLAMAGGGDQLMQLYPSAATDDEKVEIIRSVGMFYGSKRPNSGADQLAGLYTGASDRPVSEAVLQGLFMSGNAQALVDIAKKETDPALKRKAVQELSQMRGNKIATDYLMQLLNQ